MKLASFRFYFSNEKNSLRNLVLRKFSFFSFEKVFFIDEYFRGEFCFQLKINGIFFKK